MKMSTKSCKYHKPKTGTSFLKFQSNNATANNTPNQDEFVECDMCINEGNRIQAQGYCIRCKNYLCSECHMAHQKNHVNWKHVFIPVFEAPTSEKTSSSTQSLEECPKHNYQKIEFFCKRHLDVFCSDCRDKEHGECFSIIPINMAAKRTKSAKDLHQTFQTVKELLKQFEDLRTAKIYYKEHLLAQKTDCLHSVQNLRKEIDANLNLLEKNLISEINKRFDKEVDDADNSKSLCENNLSELRDKMRDLEQQRPVLDVHAFIEIIKTKKQIADCHKTLMGLQKDSKLTNISFEPNHKLIQLLKDRGKSGLGDLKLTSSKSKCDRSTNEQSVKNRVQSDITKMTNSMCFTKISEHDIHFPDDVSHTCSVTGSTFLSDGRLLLCDAQNHMLKMLDQNFEQKSALKLPSAPCDITVSTNKIAIVTLPDLKELHFVTLTSGLRRLRIIPTVEACNGICAHKEGLFVACYNHGVYGTLLLLDLNGRVKRRFNRVPVGGPVFQGPYYIALDKQSDRIYVTDKASDTLVALTFGGKILFRYWHYLPSSW